uniref:Uncharacterized protein n=1 Tax=Anguilla anguilla TaxID=7936 RepID=A0A0E9VQX3_ANGAN
MILSSSEALRGLNCKGYVRVQYHHFLPELSSSNTNSVLNDFTCLLNIAFILSNGVMKFLIV